MTYKEAFDIISSNYCIGCEHCNPKDCGECSGSWSMLEALVNDADKYRWHDLRKNPEDLPPTEVEVDIAYEVNVRNGLKFINTARAFYEDGTITSEDSSKMCYDFDYCEAWEYDEETDSYIISKGWYEAVKFTENTVVISTPIIAWRHIKPFKEADV